MWRAREFKEKLLSAPDPKALLARLDDDSAETRDAAQAELEKMGDEIEPQLRALLKNSPSAEVAARVATLLQEIERPLVRSSNTLRRIRAVQALEMAQDRASLQALSAAPSKRVRDDAVAALTRLSRRH